MVGTREVVVSGQKMGSEGLQGSELTFHDFLQKQGISIALLRELTEDEEIWIRGQSGKL